jgi:tRNA (cytosine38-C5)-methyltransferase
MSVADYLVQVANLMCFPASFQQPSDATDKQMYKTLGNSVNVRVVSALLSFLLSF